MIPSTIPRLTTVLAALCTWQGIAAAQAPLAGPRIDTNQAYVESAIASASLPVGDPMAMFGYVFGGLPERVTVYPTENYYYFSFVHGHVRYAGNFRLDVTERDQGKINFAYYQDLAEWKDQDPIQHRLLDARNGVKVEKVEPLVYRVTYKGKSVIFALNDLRGVKPPANVLGPDETYIGPVFDESAMRFFLVFNRKLKIFHFVLDETIEIADQLIPIPDSDRVLIGKRTGFGYYRDLRLDRKILIGVFEGNSRINNYFDGPFDQLPDNFIEGQELHDAIVAADPELAGKIDRFGISPGGDDRYLIAPYRHYRNDEDLLAFHECATNKKIAPDRYYECFVFDDDTGLMRAEMRRPKVAAKPVKHRPNATPPKKP
jgi:hypothetical protein